MSTLKADTIQSTSGGAATLTKQSAAKAWNNCNGESGTIRNSFNVTGITDNGTGDYTTSFTNSFANVNHATGGLCFEVGSTGNNDQYVGIKRRSSYSDSVTAGIVRTQTSQTTNGAAGDRSFFINTHGDLA